MNDSQPITSRSQRSDHDHTLRLVPAIAHGTVIDHLPTDVTLTVAQLIADHNDEVLIGVNFQSRHLGRKGVIKITGRELSSTDLSRLALVAPDATMAIIRDYTVVRKGPLPIPEHIVNIARCPNPNCVTNHEPCATAFRVEQDHPIVARCQYCERSFLGQELLIP
ncbi:MAG: aspartate carbamoyltransferase regulatory subunit [Planctomycetota bacterium]|nr:MAG: aspartate carbamoyltransferase regulatory subunit [Planctomycetota bacterium]